MAYIKQHSKNTYQITVRNGKDSNGKYIRVTMNYTPKETAPSKIKKEVAAVAADFEKRVQEGRYYSGEKNTFKNVSDLWIRDHVVRNVTPNIAHGYQAMLDNRICPAIGHLPIGRITPLNLNDLYHSMSDDGLAASTIRRYHSVVSGVFKFAYNGGLIEKNPCDRVTLPRVGKRYKYKVWTSEQLEVFFNAVTSQYTFHVLERHRVDSSGNVYRISGYDVEKHLSSMYICLFTLIFFSNARRGEICCLTWEDVDFKSSELSITKAVSCVKGEGLVVKEPKTASGNRRISLPDRCMTALKSWRKEEIRLSFELGTMWEGYTGRDFDKNYIFIQKHSGKMLHVDTISDKFREIVKRYNESCDDPVDRLPEIRLHDLRHTGASLLLSEGVDVITVSHRLGHAKPSTTMDIYSHAFPSKDQEASSALDNMIRKAKS